MLSRIAESLYWIGRYAERAEDTARILDVHVHRLLEDPSVDEDAACRALLGVMGMQRPTEPRRQRRRRRSSILAFDTPDTTSIVGGLGAARENARGAREAISSEMWECLNTTYNALPGIVARAVAGGPPPCLLLGQGAGRDPRRPGRLDHEPRRRLAVPRPRPQPRAGRHDGPAAARPAFGDADGARRVGDHAALLLGPRGVPAHLPARGRGRPGRRVPAARPAVPPLGLPRPGPGRDVPGRARAQRRPGRARRRGPAHPRAGPAPSSSSAASRS